MAKGHPTILKNYGENKKKDNEKKKKGLAFLHI